MIIAITGYKGSGKDTVAKMIQYYFACKRLNEINQLMTYTVNEVLKWNKFDGSFIKNEDCSFQIKKFASKLKQICALAINCRVEDFESEEFKNSPLPDAFQLPHDLVEYKSGTNNKKTYRWLLQHFADKIKDVIGKDYFINELFQHYTPDKNWIISDLRFTKTSPEEHAIKSRGRIIIRVDRFDSNPDTHHSETEIDLIKPDYIINNNNKNISIEELYIKVSDILRSNFG